jgi:hypothetical protein
VHVVTDCAALSWFPVKRMFTSTGQAWAFHACST